MTTPIEFAPERIFDALNSAGVRYVVIGGIAATLHGSPLRTGDADVCPARNPENLARLAEALRAIEATIRTGTETVPMPFDAGLLATSQTWNLSTRHGDLDLAFVPAGTSGFDDLVISAETYDLGEGLLVPVASLDDVIRSKRAANRRKDREALPVLEALRDEGLPQTREDAN